MTEPKTLIGRTNSYISVGLFLAILAGTVVMTRWATRIDGRLENIESLLERTMGWPLWVMRFQASNPNINVPNPEKP